MLGSLTFYRRILKDSVFSSSSMLAISRVSSSQTEIAKKQVEDRLPTIGHGIAGIMAGGTVSFVAAPVEHIKARLQVQYAADKSKRLYSGPIDCITKIVRDSCAEISYKHVLTQNFSLEPTEYEAYTTVFLPPSSFAPFSFSGGAPTTFSPAISRTTPNSPHLPSTFGPVVFRLKSSGSRPTRRISSSSES